MPQFIATVPPGFEYLLVDELKKLGVDSANEGLTQVLFDCDWPTLYRVCLWSRLANRILYPIETFEASSDEMLYEEVRQIDWDLHLSSIGTLAVDFVSRKSNIQHERYGAQKVKDAIVDYFRDEYGERPSVDTTQPDLWIHCRLNKDVATLCIDLSGRSLHQRGYRVRTGDAPLKENLAAAILHRAHWPEISDAGGWLLDPMCGSGTLVIEAAMMSANIAPGLTREYWGFLGWKPFHRALWQEEKEKAQVIVDEIEVNSTVRIFASDMDARALSIARDNAQSAGVDSLIDWQNKPLSDVERPNFENKGVVVTNPPYGERLSENDAVIELYRELGNKLKQLFVGDSASVLSAHKPHGHSIGVRARKIYKLNNGTIPCELLCFQLDEKNFVIPQMTGELPENWRELLSDSATMLANRLEKNKAQLKSFIRQQNLSCYRIYDADLPEYAAAIDIYNDCIHIQEYTPPKTVEPQKAFRRLKDIEKVAAGIMDVSMDKVFVKSRSRQKGADQYTKNDEKHHQIFVKEGKASLEVNLSDYLDTGLFPDHRKIRQTMPKWCGNGSFLNLFCYTGVASVHAALAGARTVNVDLSNTYLNWAKRNFDHNHLNVNEHQFVRQNCMEWLSWSKALKERYDVIFIDPPTFSNSKKMEQHFDIQVDHVQLLTLALDLLKPDGRIIFSNNFKKFQMNYVPPNEWECVDITRETTSRDFSRKPLHKCWQISKKAG